MALVATEVRGACLLLCASGTWDPVRYGVSGVACLSLEVMVCQKLRHEAVILYPGQCRNWYGDPVS